MQFFRVTVILGLAFFLSGCPVVETNQIGVNQPNSSPLPHPLDSHKALVYLVQPTFRIDAYMVVATALEGLEYWGSEVYIDKHYLGALDDLRMICFYANPGIYDLHFDNEGATPKTINETIHLESNKAYFYGLSEKNTTLDPKGSKIKFMRLPTNIGKNYLAWYKHNRALPDRCLSDIFRLPSRPSKTYYIMKIRNETDISYQVTQNPQKSKNIEEKTINLPPNQSYQFPPVPKTIIVNSAIEFSFTNKNNQKEMPVFITAIKNRLSYYANPDRDRPIGWRHDSNNIFFAYKKFFPSVISFEICTQSSKAIDIYITCTTIIKNKDQANGTAIY